MATATRRFSRARLEALDAAKIIGVRSGAEHRYTGVWVVVAEGRAFVRSWSDRPTGWYRAFVEQPRGSITVGAKEVKVRARPVRSERLRGVVSDAYAAKYDTKASQKWVRGFRAPRREATTMELVPA